MPFLAKWSFRLDKHPREGEDAFPIRWEREGELWLAVFDGLGGSGARPISVGNSRPRSHAWHASREARKSVVIAMQAPGDPIEAEELEGIIKHHLQRELAAVPPAPSRLRGQTIRDLPTTFAAVRLVEGPSGLSVRVFWAGDSRVYALSPQLGLQQITRDDTEVSVDAFEAIRIDPPMNNVVQASADFILHEAGLGLQAPALLFIAATDGCFHYVQAPQLFELLLLEAMSEAADFEMWRDATRQRIDAIRQDDASMAVAAWGWTDFDEMKACFAPRIAGLCEQRERFGDDLAGWWDAYREGYESALSARIPGERVV